MGTYGEEKEMPTKFQLQHQHIREHMRDVRMDGRIILKGIFNKLDSL